MIDPQSPNDPAMRPHSLAGDYVAGDKIGVDKLLGDDHRVGTNPGSAALESTYPM
jgi:hypothetical protein